MKTISTYILFFIGAALFSTQAYSQQPDSLKKAKVKYLSKTLSVSESKAQQVASILDQYKAAANQAASDKNLSQQQIRTKLDLLIDEKNSRLEKILTEQQLLEIIPTTERRKDKKGTSTNH